MKIDDALQILNLSEMVLSPELLPQISLSFKALALRWHPDKNGNSVESTERFQAIIQAKLTLIDSIHNHPVTQVTQAKYKVNFHESEIDGYNVKFAHGCPKISSKSYMNYSWDHKDPALDYIKAHIRTYPGEAELNKFSPSTLRSLFNSHKLWAAYVCNSCDMVCARLRPAKYMCLCGHRLNAHDAGSNFCCTANGCSCTKYDFLVQNNAWISRCGCKHTHLDHSKSYPRSCTKCASKGLNCKAFKSNYVCNCGHGAHKHSTKFVFADWHPVGREWIVHALRPETLDIVRQKRGGAPVFRRDFEDLNAGNASPFLEIENDVVNPQPVAFTRLRGNRISELRKVVRGAIENSPELSNAFTETSACNTNNKDSSKASTMEDNLGATMTRVTAVASGRLRQILQQTRENNGCNLNKIPVETSTSVNNIDFKSSEDADCEERHETNQEFKNCRTRESFSRNKIHQSNLELCSSSNMQHHFFPSNCDSLPERKVLTKEVKIHSTRHLPFEMKTTNVIIGRVRSNSEVQSFF